MAFVGLEHIEVKVNTIHKVIKHALRNDKHVDK